MRILFVSPRQCWPAVSGAKLRDYHFARGLGALSEVTYIFFAERGGRPPGAAELPFCSRVIAVPQPDMYTPAKILRGVLGPLPLPLVNYTSAAMFAALKDVLQTNSFDLVHLDSIHMMPYEKLFRGLPVVYNWHNIESEAMRRFSETVAHRGKRLIAQVTAGKLKNAEKQILRNAFGHIVCSEREQIVLQRLAPGTARIAVVYNGVDVAGLRDDSASDAGRFRLLYVGSMGYHANADAALWFSREVWPTVREGHPEWRLTFVGSNPPQNVLALNAERGIEVTGTVPDVKPYYREAAAAVVPLRTGGGTRLKILEAMAAGIPVISTALGAEGLPVVPGRDLLIASDKGEWLPALERVTGDTALRASLIQAGQQLVEGFDWDLLGRSLYQIYEKWLQSSAA